MKALLITLLLFLTSSLYAQSDMTPQHISTQLGSLAVYQRIVPNTTPILFLHGVYFDHQLWQHPLDLIQDRTVIAIDMPLHGQSKGDIPATWTVEDCGNMILEVLDSLNIEQVIAIGHSWGSMSILRAAHHSPQRFLAVGLGNMPFEAASSGSKWQFRFQHLVVPFRKFYARQAAKSLYGKVSLQEQPELTAHLERPMSLLSNREIKTIDRAVILRAKDSRNLIHELQVPAIGLKGEEDYVPVSDAISYRIIPGGHVSPLEQPEEVMAWIEAVIQLAQEPLTR